MHNYQFTTDSKSSEYCDLIIDHMVTKMGLTTEQALSKMNAMWNGQSIVGERDLIYHQDVDYWADFLVHGNCVRRKR